MDFHSCHEKRNSDNACFVYLFVKCFLLLLADSQLQNLSQIKVFCAFQKIQTHLILMTIVLCRLTMFFHHLSSVIHPLSPLRWLLVLLKFSSSYSFVFLTIFFWRKYAVTLASFLGMWLRLQRRAKLRRVLLENIAQITISY